MNHFCNLTDPTPKALTSLIFFTKQLTTFLVSTQPFFMGSNLQYSPTQSNLSMLGIFLTKPCPKMAILISLAFQISSGLIGLVIFTLLQTKICLAILSQASSIEVIQFLSCSEFIKKHYKYLVYRYFVTQPLFYGSKISTIGFIKSQFSFMVSFRKEEKSNAETLPWYLMSIALQTISRLIIRVQVDLTNAKVAKLMAQKSYAQSFLYLSMFYLTAFRLYQRILSLSPNEQLFSSPKMSTSEYFCFIYSRYFSSSFSLVLRANISLLYSSIDFQYGIQRILAIGCKEVFKKAI